MLRKILDPFKEFGLAMGLLYLLDRVLSGTSPHLRLYVYEFMVQPVMNIPLLSPRFAASLEIREISAGAAEIASMPVPGEVVQARFAQGCTCLGAFKDGRLVGYMWYRRSRYEEDEVRCSYVPTPPTRSVFDFDFYILPEYRMGTAFAGLWKGAIAHLASRGVDYTFSRMTRFNTASRRAHRRLGSRVAGRAMFLRLWRIEVMLATIAPYVHLSTTKTDRVQVVLRADVLDA